MNASDGGVVQDSDCRDAFVFHLGGRGACRVVGVGEKAEGSEEASSQDLWDSPHEPHMQTPS